MGRYIVIDPYQNSLKNWKEYDNRGQRFLNNLYSYFADMDLTTLQKLAILGLQIITGTPQRTDNELSNTFSSSQKLPYGGEGRGRRYWREGEVRDVARRSWKPGAEGAAEGQGEWARPGSGTSARGVSRSLLLKKGLIHYQNMKRKDVFRCSEKRTGTKIWKKIPYNIWKLRKINDYWRSLFINLERTYFPWEEM